MKTEIGAYDSTSRDVHVTFTSGEVVHTRRVNACHDKSDAYDAKATEARVVQVALGVAAKIEAGVITPAVEEAKPVATGKAVTA